MNARAQQARTWLDRLTAAAARLRGAPVRFMEVCGTHTVSAFRCGLHSLMPPNVRLLSGPGCPVCVTSQGDVDQLIALSGRAGVTLCTYGDMLRVTGSDRGSLQEARSRGADVRVIYSAMDAVNLAQALPDRQVVLAAVGFETTTPATAVAVLAARRRGLGNFSVFASHKQILPAMRALLDAGDVRINGFLLPGHVSVITGAACFAEIVERYRLPCVVVGFEDVQIAEGIALLTEMAADGRWALENLYPEAVCDDGNRRALELIDRVFKDRDERWRGLATLPASGRALRPEYADFDARLRFHLPDLDVPEPRGCRCGEVICGRCTPVECRLFGTVCTPVHAVGPCMVSSEGTCQAWFKYGAKAPAAAPARAAKAPALEEVA